MRQPHLPAIFISYNDLMTDASGPVEQIRAFLNVPLDGPRMAAAIDPALYRNRE